jgi:hypothetical protein
MYRLHEIKDTLIHSVARQMKHIDSVDTEELGEVVDMIKDIAEAIYYCTVTEAMEGHGEGRSNQYYGGNSGQGYYTEREYPIEMKEGRSPNSRRMYMEAKEQHHPKEAKMRELERYAQELTQDISEMIEDASPEERQTLARKLGTLVSKINNV